MKPTSTRAEASQTPSNADQRVVSKRLIGVRQDGDLVPEEHGRPCYIGRIWSFMPLNKK